MDSSKSEPNVTNATAVHMHEKKWLKNKLPACIIPTSSSSLAFLLSVFVPMLLLHAGLVTEGRGGQVAG